MSRLMKNSGIKWIGDIPCDWGKAKIKNVSSTIGSGTTPPSNNIEYYDGDINWIQSGDLYQKSEIVNTSIKISNYAKTTIPALKVYNPPYIVMAMYGASVGNTAISKISACTNQACCVIKPNSKTHIKFLFHWLRFCQNDFLSQALGGGQPNISQIKIKNQVVILPPLVEQEAIARYLDEKCGEIDKLLSDLDAEVRTLSEYKKSIIAETVTHGLNPNAKLIPTNLGWIDTIPQHWTLEKAKYTFVLRRTKGNTINLELLSPTQKYGVIPQSQLEGVVLVNEKTNLETFRTIHKGDFCISLRSFQGGFEYSTYEGVVSPAYQVFYPTIDICDGYFKYLFKADGFISKINTFSMSLRDGKNIAFDDFGNMYIPIPPIDEQIAIANYLDNKIEHINQAITDKLTQMESLRQYKASLIYEYVTGKKQVQCD